MYRSKELESIFVEISTKKGKNLIICCIYKHPSMTINDFTENYVSRLLEKLTFENKQIILMGDFNINLINSNSDTSTSDFLDLITSNSLMPLIHKPTRITSTSKTLIDNILTNKTEDNIISGNITCSISDHLAQFAIFETHINAKKPRQHQVKRNFKHFIEENFILDILAIDWGKQLKLRNKNASLSMEALLHQVHKTLDIHAPLKKCHSV